MPAAVFDSVCTGSFWRHIGRPVPLARRLTLLFLRVALFLRFFSTLLVLSVVGRFHDGRPLQSKQAQARVTSGLERSAVCHQLRTARETDTSRPSKRVAFSPATALRASSGVFISTNP